MRRQERKSFEADAGTSRMADDDNGVRYYYEDGKWWKKVPFYNTPYVVSRESVPAKFLKRDKSDGNSHKRKDSAAPEPAKHIPDKQASARVARFKKRNEERDTIVASALNASVECENTPEAQRLSRPLNNNAAITGLKSVINGEDRCLEMKLDDFFHIDNLLEYAQSKNVIVMNGYEFLTAHDTRQIYFDGESL
ncbi:hypothetical protein DdX_04956 [Ditylenchus destructor]|uniref:Uncharacterized protein n=1 Tax=Ditylenchus destructor TaxID=166010 RepID=A0AAD4NBT2_9BILA|nr:hypothetical protein DdX_04956 [Ditylenchus destructor]